MTNAVMLGDRLVGPGEPTYVIAELSANHQYDLNRAMRMIEAAQEAGADAVKLQTYTADTMTIDADSPPFVTGKDTLWAGRRLYELYADAATPWEWHRLLLDTATELGLQLFSTPFDASAVEFLDAFDPPCFKIAWFELVDLPLIREAASRGRTLIMSTGMASEAEIDEAISAAREGGAPG